MTFIAIEQIIQQVVRGHVITVTIMKLLGFVKEAEKDFLGC